MVTPDLWPGSGLPTISHVPRKGCHPLMGTQRQAASSSPLQWMPETDFFPQKVAGFSSSLGDTFGENLTRLKRLCSHVLGWGEVPRRGKAPQPSRGPATFTGLPPRHLALGGAWTGPVSDLRPRYCCEGLHRARGVPSHCFSAAGGCLVLQRRASSPDLPGAQDPLSGAVRLSEPFRWPCRKQTSSWGARVRRPQATLRRGRNGRCLCASPSSQAERCLLHVKAVFR